MCTLRLSWALHPLLLWRKDLRMQTFMLIRRRERLLIQAHLGRARTQVDARRAREDGVELCAGGGRPRGGHASHQVS